MNAIIKVWRNGKESGVCGVYNDCTKETIIKKWAEHKNDYAKFDKGASINLKLFIDDILSGEMWTAT